MRVAVVGAGGLGGRYAVLLAQAGAEVSVIARGAHLEAIRGKGLTMRHFDEDVATVQLPATDDPGAVGAVDLVLFCVKAYDLETAAAQALPLFDEHTLVLPIQNGVTISPTLQQVIGEGAVLGGATYASGSVVEPGVISYGHIEAPILFGELTGGESERTAKLQKALDDAGLPAELRADMPVVLWEKFVAICASAGVLAVLRLPLGAAFETPECGELLLGVMREVEALSHATGIGLDEGIADRQFAYFRDKVAPSTRSSQLNDLLNGRRLELEYLNGAAVRLGEELGVPTPLNRFCYAALKPYLDGAPDR